MIYRVSLIKKSKSLINKLKNIGSSFMRKAKKTLNYWNSRETTKCKLLKFKT